METTYRYREEWRMIYALGRVAAVLGFILALIGIAELFSIGMKEHWLLPLYIPLAIWAVLCIFIWVRCGQLARYSIKLSDDCICIGNMVLPWDQIQSVVHHPSRLLRVEFRIIAYDGRKADVYSTVEGANRIEAFVRSKL